MLLKWIKSYFKRRIYLGCRTDGYVLPKLFIFQCLCNPQYMLNEDARFHFASFNLQICIESSLNFISRWKLKDANSRIKMSYLAPEHCCKMQRIDVSFFDEYFISWVFSRFCRIISVAAQEVVLATALLQTNSHIKKGLCIWLSKLQNVGLSFNSQMCISHWSR